MAEALIASGKETIEVLKAATEAYKKAKAIGVPEAELTLVATATIAAMRENRSDHQKILEINRNATKLYTALILNHDVDKSPPPLAPSSSASSRFDDMHINISIAILESQTAALAAGVSEAAIADVCEDYSTKLGAIPDSDPSLNAKQVHLATETKAKFDALLHAARSAAAAAPAGMVPAAAAATAAALAASADLWSTTPIEFKAKLERDGMICISAWHGGTNWLQMTTKATSMTAVASNSMAIGRILVAQKLWDACPAADCRKPLPDSVQITYSRSRKVYYCTVLCQRGDCACQRAWLKALSDIGISK